VTTRAPELYAAQLARVQRVLSWHVSATARRYRARRMCMECGMPYPCRTRLELLGHTVKEGK
jgi:hypothetical protein